MRTDSDRHSNNHSTRSHLGDAENAIPGHTRDCSLRSVSPLLDSGLLNRVLLPTDSAETVLAHTFAKRYELIRQENERLRQTIITQDEQIEKLKKIVKSLQLNGSDDYSSESRYDKSVSSNSHIPMLRVTPQKRSSTSSSTQTPRSPRSSRRSHRRLQLPDTSESESTPTLHRSPLLQSVRTASRTPILETHTEPSRRVPETPHQHRNRSSLRMAQEDSPTTDIILGHLLDAGRRASRTRPVAISRTISSQELASQASGTPQHHSTAFFTETNGRERDLLNNPVPNIAYFLKHFHPKFLENSEKRVELVRKAARYRSEIEAARKDIARKVSNGESMTKQQQDILLTDPTRIKAFNQQEMCALTRKRVFGTREHIKKVEQREFEHDRRANRVLAEVHSERTRRRVVFRTTRLRPQSSLGF